MVLNMVLNVVLNLLLNSISLLLMKVLLIKKAYINSSVYISIYNTKSDSRLPKKFVLFVSKKPL